MPKDEAEGRQPDQIVGYANGAEAQGQTAAVERLRHTNRPEQLPQKSNHHDGPMAQRIAGGGQVAYAIHTDNHPDALPQFRIVRRGHAGPAENGEWEQDRKRPEQDVIDSRGNKNGAMQFQHDTV